MDRFDHCTHPDRDFCDCDWCRYLYAEKKKATVNCATCGKDTGWSGLDGAINLCGKCWAEAANAQDDKRAKAEKEKREKRNAANRARYHARRDLGLVRTPYGWE